MLTAAQQYAIDQFAKGLLALDDDALIDTYHQALEDLRAARAEGSENHSKAYAQTLAAQQKEATRRRAQGATLDELARSYNVGISTIRRATRTA
jgi:DNA-binding CsgD family transcriptional regulator